MDTSVKIEFSKLQNMTQVDEPYSHIHGYLNFEIDSRSVPHMGFEGPDDVCFNDWIEVFVEITKALQDRLPSYIFDGCEQGEPAFSFDLKPESHISFSIIASECGGGCDDSDWQNIIFTYEDFMSAFLAFKSSYLTEISKIAPDQLEYWTERFRT